MRFKKTKPVETVEERGESITLEGSSIEVDDVVIDGDELMRSATPPVCKCDHTTRSSGFCIHGNNI